MSAKPANKLKLILACIGAGFCVAGAILAITAFTADSAAKGPSELTLHPENQEQIVARRRAAEFQHVLSLTDEQTAQLTEVIVLFRRQAKEIRWQNAGNNAGLFMAGRRKMEEFDQALRKILTSEQWTQYQERKMIRRERFGALQQLLPPVR